MRLWGLILILCGIVFWQYGDRISLSNPINSLPPKRLAPNAPVQLALPAVKLISHENFTFTAHHSFELTALVLSKKSYRFDAESKISPIDLALGWGAMSNPAPLRLINIRQSGRFYYTRYQLPPPISRNVMISSSSNMHMVPANDLVLKGLKRAKKGRLVHIKGYLIDAKRKDGWFWQSSITRNDSGKGACELVYVTSIEILPKPQ